MCVNPQHSAGVRFEKSPRPAAPLLLRLSQGTAAPHELGRDKAVAMYRTMVALQTVDTIFYEAPRQVGGSERSPGAVPTSLPRVQCGSAHFKREVPFLRGPAQRQAGAGQGAGPGIWPQTSLLLAPSCAPPAPALGSCMLEGRRGPAFLLAHTLGAAAAGGHPGMQHFALAEALTHFSRAKNRAEPSRAQSVEGHCVTTYTAVPAMPPCAAPVRRAGSLST